METSITSVITALGALGTASFGLVDATKAFWGGISRCGIRNIRDAIQPLFGDKPSTEDRSNPLTFASVLGTLSANWMNGTDLTDQKAIAKTLLKLRLSPDNAGVNAAATGLGGDVLTNVATKINTGQALNPQEADAFGRFDLALTALLDEGYQRADQRYRNWAKVLAGFFAIVISLLAGWDIACNPSFGGKPSADYWFTPWMGEALLAGALATPLAPVAKDLTSAIAAGVDAVQKIRKP